MDAREFAEWMAFDRIEPLGRPWLQTGILAMLLFNAHRDPKKTRAMRPEDFMPLPRRQQTWQEMLAVMKEVTRGHPPRRQRGGR